MPHVGEDGSRGGDGKDRSHQVTNGEGKHKNYMAKYFTKKIDMQIAKEMTENQFIVAALIATVTFTAGFTIPGGFNNEKGPTQGAAILAKNRAFQAFIVTNTIAMAISSSAVSCQVFMVRHKYKFYDRIVEDLLNYTLFSMLSMGIAFITGTYAVLQHSLALAIPTCVIGVLFLLSVCVVHAISSDPFTRALLD